MAGTFIFAPAVSILIDTDDHGTIDISDDLVSGDIILNEDAPHNLSIRVENPRRKYDGVFAPNDRVVVRLKRIRWVQVMAGYLNSVPFASVWPRTVDISASCTLKKLLWTYYDPGAIETATLLSQFVNASAIRGTGTPQAGTVSEDGSLAERAQALMIEVAKWDPEQIHIARLPPDWWEKVKALYAKISPVLETATSSLIQSGASIYGQGTSVSAEGATVNNNNSDPSIMGPPTMTAAELVEWWKSKTSNEPVNGTREQIAQWYIDIGNSEGVRGDLAFMQACVETQFFVSGSISGGYHWQNKNNPSGVKAYDSNPGASQRWATPQEGILGHIQLLKKYAMGNDVKLNNPDKAPRAGGSASTVMGLGGSTTSHPTWATATNYGASIVSFWKGALSLSKKSTKGASTTKDPIDAAGHTSPGQANVDRQGIQGTSGTTDTPVYPVPGGQDKHNYGSTDSLHSSGHKGTDIGAPEGTPIYAALGGRVDRADDGGGYNNGNGNCVKITMADGTYFMYLHMQTGSVMVKVGDEVKKGQQIGKVGSTGHSTGPHLHFEYHPGGGGAASPNDLLHAAEQGNAYTAATGVTTNTSGTPPLLGSTYMPARDTVSSLLIGPRMLMNDEPLFNPVSALIKASMRSFCSAPNGDLIAWFPDYFGTYGLTASMTIEDIELMDFTIDWDDSRLITHQFVTGSTTGWNGIATDPQETITLMAETMGVASLDFPEILEAIIGKDAGDWTNPSALLGRFGARPDHQTFPALINKEGDFFMAVHLFKQNWASQFVANATISFMPELWPGMIVKIPSQGIQLYAKQVRHSFNFSQGGGFSTRVQFIAPASLDGRLAGLPQAKRGRGARRRKGES